MLGFQELFDRAWHGLKEQRFVRSVRVREYLGVKAESCAYEGEHGCRCAIGQLFLGRPFPDTTDRNLGSIYDLPLAALRELGVVLTARPSRNDDARGGDERLTFLEALQVAHDESASPEEMEKNLREFAAEHELTVPA